MRLAAFAPVLLALAAQLASAQLPAPTPGTVSVSGSADVRVKPDHVVLELGVQANAPDLATAKREHDAVVERVVKYLRETLGEANVKTDYLSISPHYEWESGQRTYFTVQKTIIATLQKVSEFEAVLDRCVGLGVTHVHGVQFRTKELKKHRETARALAVKAALEKASLLAKEAGARAGRVLSITEETWGGWSAWSPGSWGRSWGNAGTAQVSVSTPSSTDDAQPTLPLGEITVSASVRLTAALVDQP